jgi:predicted phage baseplate assembly protein
MPLPQPILDDRSYEQLRDELVRRIPVYAPEWTDFNASDPGITLIELFSFLGENLLFRFNQIPETTKLQFLRLLDVPLRPASVAEGFVTFTTQQPDGVLVEQRTGVRAGSVPFQTTVEAKVWPVSARAVGRLRRGDPSTDEETAYATRSWDAYRASESATGGSGEKPAYYTTQVLGEDPTAPGATALDLSSAVDGTLWLAVLGEKGVDVPSLAGGTLNIGIAPDTDVLSMADVVPCPGAGGTSSASSITWQISTGRVDDGTPRYHDLSPVGDTTSALTRPGVVRLDLPPKTVPVGLFAPADPDAAGTGDFPPEIDAQLEAKLVFWLRAFRADGEQLGRLLWANANAATIEQVQEASAEFLGTGTGDASQTAKLVHAPVLPGTLRLDVEEASGWTPWREVDDFDASREDDRHFVLDPEAGTVTFGNGVRGAAPQIGQRIRARGYRYGGGGAGNVPARGVSRTDVANVKVSNPLPTRGGSETEAVGAALERVPGELRRHDRAVTASDFRELAFAAPGAALGRAECLPRFHPKVPDVVAAGVVSVVVWPRDDPRHPSAPVPDRPTLDLVCRFLDARRLVTTELYVIPPTYRKVAVAVGLQTKPGYGVDAVRRWVELVIRQYLAPLPPYGPDGGGWPLGRRVHGPELEAAALQVEGVEYLEGLTVAGTPDGGATWVTSSPRPIELEPYEVVELAEITVVQGAPLPAGQAPAPATSDVPVPVPVPRDEC